MIAAVSEKAFAKVNLSLHLGRIRDDGYHEIDTVMQSLALCDELYIEHAAVESFKVEGTYSAVPTGKENLVLCSLELMRDFTGRRKPLSVRLVKNIPSGAGLAGGSSDAFSMLRAFSRLYDLNLSEKEYLSLALKLGSDVPFFYYGGTVRAAGRGELLTPLDDISRLHVVVVKPSFAISTPEAYAAWDESGFEPVSVPELFYNDFERVLFPRYNILADIKRRLSLLGASAALLTGSGSCMCGYFDSGDKAKKCAVDEFLNGYGDIILTETAGRFF